MLSTSYELEATFTVHATLVRVAAMPDGRLVSSGRHGLILQVWDRRNGWVKDLEGHEDSITCIVALSDRRIISGSSDHTLRYWDVSEGRCLKTFSHSYEVGCAADLLDGRVISGAANKLKIWDLAAGSCLLTLTTPDEEDVTAVAALASSRVISGGWAEPSTLTVWDLSTGRSVHQMFAHNGPVINIAALSDGRVVSGGMDDTIRVWDMRDLAACRCLLTLRPDGLLYCLALLPDSRLAAGLSNSITCWDLDNGRCLQQLAGQGIFSRHVTVLPDGHIATTSMDAIRIYYDRTRHLEKKIAEKVGQTRACADVVAVITKFI